MRWIVLSPLLLAACQTAASVGASCHLRSDCIDPLICAGGSCRTECAADVDCPGGWSCAPSGTARVLACLPPASPRLCAYNSECPSSAFCVDHQCRAQCMTDRDCASGTCNDGTCTAPIVTPPAVDAGTIEGGACTMCGGRCVDLSTDAAHCGACGNACPAGNACTGGHCGAGHCDDAGMCCPDGLDPCDGACVDFQSDPQHCSFCGLRCPSGICIGGQCADVNDDCAHALPIDVSSGSGSANLQISSSDGPSGASCGDASDVYFSFTLAQRSIVLVNVVGGSLNIAIRASCDSAPVGCTSCRADVFDPGTHYIAVSGTISAPVNGTVAVYTLPVPSQVQGVIIPDSMGAMNTFTGTTVGAANTPGSCGAGPDVMYVVGFCGSLPNGTIHADTCTGASFASVLGIAASSGVAGVCETSAACGTGGQRVSWPVPSGGGLYALYVDGATAADSGTYTLNVTIP